MAIGKSPKAALTRRRRAAQFVKFPYKFVEALPGYRIADALHQIQIIMQVVDRVQARAQHFLAFVQMLQIRARVVAAGVATASFVQRPGIELVLVVADFDLPFVRPLISMRTFYPKISSFLRFSKLQRIPLERLLIALSL